MGVKGEGEGLPAADWLTGGLGGHNWLVWLNYVIAG